MFARFRKYFVILGGFLIHLSLGNFYTFGNIHPYIKEYMGNYSLSKDHVTLGNSVWIFGLMAFGLGSSITLGHYIEGKIGPTWTCLIGGWLMSANVVLTSITFKTYLWVVALNYGFLAGVGTGIAYGVALTCPCHWFPNQKGLVSGIIVGGFGLSAFMFDYIQTMVLNINDKLDIQMLPKLFTMLGSIYAVLVFFGSCMLKKAPCENEFRQNSPFLSISEPQEETRQFRPYQLFFEYDFWILWLTFALNAANVILVLSLYKSYGNKLNLPDNTKSFFLTYVGQGGAICNCLGRFIFGFAYDRLPYKVVMSFITAMTALFLATLPLSSFIQLYNGKCAMFAIWIAVLNFLVGGNFSIFPAICHKLFGAKHLTANYGILFTSASVGSIIMSIITTMILDSNGDIRSMNTVYWAGAGISTIAFLLTLIFRGRSLMRYDIKIHF